MFQRAAQLISQLGTKNDQAARNELLAMFPDGIGPGGSHGEPPPGTTIEEREDGHYLVLEPILSKSWGGPVAAKSVYEYHDKRINTLVRADAPVSKPTFPPSIVSKVLHLAFTVLWQSAACAVFFVAALAFVAWIHGHSFSETVAVIKSILY